MASLPACLYILISSMEMQIVEKIPAVGGVYVGAVCCVDGERGDSGSAQWAAHAPPVSMLGSAPASSSICKEMQVAI